MRPRHPPRPAWPALALASLLWLSACGATKPLIAANPHEPAPVQVSQGNIKMPAGVYLGGLRTIDQIMWR